MQVQHWLPYTISLNHRKLETETKWQIKDAGRRTREAVQLAAARLQKEREENWSELDSSELLKRLIDRKVLKLESGHIKDIGVAEAFGELCRKYLESGKKESEQAIQAVTSSEINHDIESNAKLT